MRHGLPGAINTAAEVRLRVRAEAASPPMRKRAGAPCVAHRCYAAHSSELTRRNNPIPLPFPAPSLSWLTLCAHRVYVAGSAAAGTCSDHPSVNGSCGPALRSGRLTGYYKSVHEAYNHCPTISRPGGETWIAPRDPGSNTRAIPERRSRIEDAKTSGDEAASDHSSDDDRHHFVHASYHASAPPLS